MQENSLALSVSETIFASMLLCFCLTVLCHCYLEIPLPQFTVYFEPNNKAVFFYTSANADVGIV